MAYKESDLPAAEGAMLSKEPDSPDLEVTDIDSCIEYVNASGWFAHIAVNCSLLYDRDILSYSQRRKA